jgi:cyclopropane-fatty-acyl-phospholipid synthase
MSYSAALFGAQPGMSLEQAQSRKYFRLLQQLDPKPGDTILEVGCGWGGLAEIAAAEFGCRVHGITLSPAQLECVAAACTGARASPINANFR